MEIYLIRHTAPEIEKGICYGQADIPLKETFQEEATVVLQGIHTPIEKVFTSPSSRCSQLAGLIRDKFQIPMILDTRLQELNFGEWELKPWDAIDPLQLKHWMDDYVTTPATGGESYHDLFRRVQQFWNEITEGPYNSVAVVTHHGVIKSIHAHLHKLRLTDAMSLNFSYGSVTVIQSLHALKKTIPT